MFSGVEGKISHKQFRAHLMIYLFSLTDFVCCQLPGLKSSLNDVP